MKSNSLHLAIVFALIGVCSSANILMVTYGGTKSHKIPFWELARGLIPRGHNITFISGFPADFQMNGLEEITPTNVVFYIRNFTDWDLLGARLKGIDPVHPLEVLRYAHEVCDTFFADPEVGNFLKRSSYDLLILDGAYPECAMGLVYHYKVPFMYINTVGFYTGSLSMAGNPSLYSFTPFFGRGLTESMTLFQRILNTSYYTLAKMLHAYTIDVLVQNILKRQFGPNMPNAYDLTRNVSFILQNGHATVTYPRPYLPNVAEIACIHCRDAKPLPKDLENFIKQGGDAGFIYVSMGSSVKADKMPEYFRRLLIQVFEQLPYRVLWKWESALPGLPENIKTSRWLPQQDLLGHRKIRAFITHGGLLSMFETVYHGVPVITVPVFCDHDANAAKAELDGYALKLELETITAETLLSAIRKIIHDPKYRNEVKRRQYLLKDQRETPMERAIYWTEYVLRHNGATHLQSPAKDMNFFQYYLIDVCIIMFLILIISLFLLWLCLKLFYFYLTNNDYLNIRIYELKNKFD